MDLEALAQATPGMVGADLANVVNEAALLAARRGHDRVAPEDLTDAIEKIVLGTERKVVQSEDDRRRIAYHEGGPRDRRHAHRRARTRCARCRSSPAARRSA